jgi:Protein of unknown function (DUF3179)
VWFNPIAVKIFSMPIANEAVPTQLRNRKLAPSLALFISSLAVFALAAYPIYVIRPFREQQPAALNHALWVLLHNKPIAAILTLVIAACALTFWRGAGWITKSFLVASVVISLIATAGTWINPYEQMFHPMGDPRFIAASQATIDPNDMVIAVTLDRESRAYPIREMGYHHIVNDRLNSLPIVVTY